MTLHLDHVEMCIRASELLDARGDVGEALPWHVLLSKPNRSPNGPTVHW